MGICFMLDFLYPALRWKIAQFISLILESINSHSLSEIHHISLSMESVYIPTYFFRFGTKQKFFFVTCCDTTVCKRRKRTIFVNMYDLYDKTSDSVSKAPATIQDSVQHSPGLAILTLPSY